MKKSHRKDVIIARIIFAVLCLLLIVLIVSVVLFVRGKLTGSSKDTQTTQTETMQQLPPESQNPDLPPVTENPEGFGDTQTEAGTDEPDASDGSDVSDGADASDGSDVSDGADASDGTDASDAADEPSVSDETDDSTSIWTNTGVNMRTEPNVNGSVITILDAGTQLTLLGEENGWVLVSYNGTQGYVCVDYITDTNPSGE
jgi:uncharacterized protein YgiM (DUF1202 family)